mmetsp:Transcript_121479/g.271335  ORF Transcript_121479/g.271335 Transcript_121479/m.271335 type:complete len:282 (+) Transcript_121479:73-918(+)
MKGPDEEQRSLQHRRHKYPGPPVPQSQRGSLQSPFARHGPRARAPSAPLPPPHGAARRPAAAARSANWPLRALAWPLARPARLPARPPAGGARPVMPTPPPARPAPQRPSAATVPPPPREENSAPAPVPPAPAEPRARGARRTPSLRRRRARSPRDVSCPESRGRRALRGRRRRAPAAARSPRATSGDPPWRHQGRRAGPPPRPGRMRLPSPPLPRGDPGAARSRAEPPAGGRAPRSDATCSPASRAPRAERPGPRRPQRYGRGAQPREPLEGLAVPRRAR